MPDTQQKAPDPGPVEVQTDQKTADVGPPTPFSLRELAKDLPERDAVEKAVKQGMLADSAQAEARAKAKVVDESRDAGDTPSGHALKKVTGVGNDTDRGERYLREKTAKRWGYVPVED